MASSRAASSRRAPPFIDPPGYARHRPEETLLYRLVEQHYPAFLAAREAAGRPLPKHVQEELEGYLKCGRFEHGFLRVKCEQCHAEKLVAFSCKGRAICPSCAARRMTETAALLVEEVLSRRPMRQWMLSLPFALRFLLARDPEVLTHVLGIVYRAIAGYILKKARLTHATGVTLIQRFGSALNLNVHFHMLFLDGAYLTGTHPPVFGRIGAPSAKELEALLKRIGVFAPHHALRATITPAGRGSGARHADAATQRFVAKHVSMTWAQRLQRVFAIEIERCRRCGGKLKVIASIEDSFSSPAPSSEESATAALRAATERERIAGQNAERRRRDPSRSGSRRAPRTRCPARRHPRRTRRLRHNTH